MDRRVEFIMKLGVSPILADVLHMLEANEVVTADMIRDILPRSKDVRLTIFRLRNKLDEFNVAVHNQRLGGYWIDNKNREKLDQLVKELPLGGGGKRGRRSRASAT